LSCGVDFNGRTILDVGCNIGMVSYEIAKTGPRLIHGIDSDLPSLAIARRIFAAVDVETRLERIDLANLQELKARLEDRYDVVLFLSVYQPLLKRRGPVARDVVRELARRCSGSLLVRVGASGLAEIAEILQAEGFALTYSGERPHAEVSALTVFSRS
jgi:ribosomal protein L11 methylase PrmA